MVFHRLAQSKTRTTRCQARKLYPACFCRKSFARVPLQEYMRLDSTCWSQLLRSFAYFRSMYESRQKVGWSRGVCGSNAETEE